MAPAIVALQRKAEEIRQAEMQRIQARLGTLTAEQIAAVEALTRGLVNKFLHPPMQALKQAAREGDAVRLDALCESGRCPPMRPAEPSAHARRSRRRVRAKIRAAARAENDKPKRAGVEMRR